MHAFSDKHSSIKRVCTVNVGEYLRKSAKSRKKGKVLENPYYYVLLPYNFPYTEPFVCHLSTPFYTGPSPTSSSPGTTKVCYCIYHSVMQHLFTSSSSIMFFSIRMVRDSARPEISYAIARNQCGVYVCVCVCAYVQYSSIDLWLISLTQSHIIMCVWHSCVCVCVCVAFVCVCVCVCLDAFMYVCAYRFAAHYSCMYVYSIVCVCRYSYLVLQPTTTTTAGGGPATPPPPPGEGVSGGGGGSRVKSNKRGEPATPPPPPGEGVSGGGGGSRSKSNKRGEPATPPPPPGEGVSGGGGGSRSKSSKRRKSTGKRRSRRFGRRSSVALINFSDGSPATTAKVRHTHTLCIIHTLHTLHTFTLRTHSHFAHIHVHPSP